MKTHTLNLQLVFIRLIDRNIDFTIHIKQWVESTLANRGEKALYEYRCTAKLIFANLFSIVSPAKEKR